MVLYMACSGRPTQEVTSGLTGEEPAQQNQGRSPPGEAEAGRGGGVGHICICGPYRPWEGIGFYPWCPGKPVEGCKQGGRWIYILKNYFT